MKAELVTRERGGVLSRKRRAYVASHPVLGKLLCLSHTLSGGNNQG